MFSTLFRKLFRNGLAVVLLAVPMTALASSTVHLDRAPINVDDHESLQRGARTFTNYCLSCHAASYMRFVRMTDIGLTEAQIKDNLLFTTDKVGSLMTVAMRPNDAKDWFGAPPPDLSVISRARGADWLYTYLRGFYRDDTRASGWNNTVFDKVGMPHVLADLQGHQVAVMQSHIGADGKAHSVLERVELAKPGRLSPSEYDLVVGDLVNYLVWMGEPSAPTRNRTGIFVLLFLSVFLVIAFYMKKAFWKDIH
ncbi:MAG: cytochrome c1 [Betaproteobacteria bacterium]|nr:MAG: cytochrome c1 [Betaproteobacteria bacterium]